MKFIKRFFKFISRKFKEYFPGAKESCKEKGEILVDFSNFLFRRAAEEVNTTLKDEAILAVESTLRERLNEVIDNVKQGVVTRWNMRWDKKINRLIDVQLRAVIIEARILALKYNKDIDDVIDPSLYGYDEVD